MRILYGVVGEGMGHAIRSRVVVDHLFQRGHDVQIVTSGRAVAYLGARFPRVQEIHGLHLSYAANAVRKGRTVWTNVWQGTTGLPRNVSAYFRLVDAFRPQVVISDFESWAYLYAKVHRLPILSLDNIQIIDRCRHPASVVEGHRSDFEIARTVIRSKLPFCHHYLVTTFFYPEVRKPRTSLLPPILRPSVLEARRREGEHLLVYQTAEGHDALLPALHDAGVECRIYGMRRGLAEEEVEGRLRFRPFDEAAFIEDLASAKAVISGGSFTLMSESVYLGKPVLSVPVAGQFEQVLNARYLEREGYGRCLEALTSADEVLDFLDRVPNYAVEMQKYIQKGNVQVLDAVDRFLLDPEWQDG